MGRIEIWPELITKAEPLVLRQGITEALMSIWQVTGHWLVFCQPLAHLAHRFEDRSKSAILD